MLKRLTQEEFMEKLTLSNSWYRDGFFEVLDVVYEPKDTVKILVKTPYGLCKPRRGDLLRGNCPTILSAIDRNEYCINQFKEKHGDKYDYSLVEYVTQKTKVKIICPKHSVFEQCPDSHKKGEKGIGCKSCALEKGMIPLSEIKRRLFKVLTDGTICDLENVNFISDYAPFTCKLGHTYEQKISDKLSGNGCPTCASITRSLYWKNILNDKDIHSIDNKLYFLKLSSNEEIIYKIGCSRDVARRVGEIRRDSGSDVEVLYTLEGSSFDVYSLENRLVYHFKKYKYKGDNKFPGHTECFGENVWEKYYDTMCCEEEYKVEMDKILCEENGINYEQQLYCK